MLLNIAILDGVVNVLSQRYLMLFYDNFDIKWQIYCLEIGVPLTTLQLKYKLHTHK